MYTIAMFVAIISGAVETIKRALKLDECFLPLLSVLLGIGIAFLGRDFSQVISGTISETILFGIILGLSASGLLSGFSSIVSTTKQIGNKIKKKKVKK